MEKTKELTTADVTDEARKLAVAWGDAYHLGTIETMQLGTQIQYVANLQSNELKAENERLRSALEHIERACDNRNDTHEQIWHITNDALNPTKD